MNPARRPGSPPSQADLEKRVAIRPLAESDRDQLLAWRNDPFIVERSLSQRPVQVVEHGRWFDALLRRTDALAWIIEIDGIAAGHARAEARGPDWLFTIYLLRQQTGQGLGVEAIRQACRLAVHRKPGAAVIAEVLPQNQAALTAFHRAGFSVEHAVGRADAVRMALRQPNEQTSTATHYRQLLAEHGDSFKALNWGSEAGQLLRFEILAGVGDLRGSAVLDVGCGLAHFADWLERRGIGVDYTGLDLVPALLEAAATRRPDLRLVQGSILDSDVLQGERFDYVFASGVFATYEAGAESVLRASVARMWELARKGVAFNALSAQASDREPGEYHADPVAVLAFCRTLAPRAQLIEGYHPRDFTIHLPRVAAGR